MMWDLKARSKMADLVFRRSIKIDDEIRSRSVSVKDYTKKRDAIIPEYFGGLGFERVTAEEWQYDPTYSHPAQFVPKEGKLFFLVCNQMVLKIDKDLAAKLLVLGLL